MKKIIFLLFFLTFSAQAHADPMKILFFYPGGQGDQQAAQPILDSFSEALKRASAGKIEAKVSYIADLQAGLKFIRTDKPQAAILPVDTFLQYGDELGATVVAKILQLPSADGTDQYFLMGKAGTTLPASGEVILISQRPLDAGFVAGKLFPAMRGTQWKIETTPNVVGALKAIGSGTKTGFVLLDQFEFANISKLKTPWAQALAPLAKSEKISAAPFVIFAAQTTPEMTAELKKALLQLTQDSAASDTLVTLRLKGFKAASSL